MTIARAALVGIILAVAAANLAASGFVGVYAVIEKVVLEPNERAPERIQIWGVFALVDGGWRDTSSDGASPLDLSGGGASAPRRGYLYFKLPFSKSAVKTPVEATRIDSAKKEWADFKRIAGTGQAIAFGGGWFYLGTFDGPREIEVRIRPESEKVTSPEDYMPHIGIVKLADQGNQSVIVTRLKQLVRK